MGTCSNEEEREIEEENGYWNLPIPEGSWRDNARNCRVLNAWLFCEL